MKKIKIITDSTCDLSKQIIEKYDIEVLPLIVRFGDESYYDGENLKSDEFFNKMKNSDIFPSTSLVSPQRFYDCYKKYIEQGYDICSIHITSKMSGTYQSACIAKEMLKADNICIVDSLNVTNGLGVLVIKACKLIQEGYSIDEIQKEINNVIPHIKSFLVFESLDNLVRGGRLSKTAGVIGSVLGIKLILSMQNGELNVVDKIRGSKKALKALFEYIENKGIKQGETSLLLHEDAVENFEVLKEYMEKHNKIYYVNNVGCVVGTHSGPNAYGIFFIENY